MFKRISKYKNTDYIKYKYNTSTFKIQEFSTFAEYFPTICLLLGTTTVMELLGKRG